ncbi:hypothetical protein ACFCZ2_30140 [Streptomyces sp. NPDC056202]|uniref:hypothetical protein n=1 Tax=unclassified Streptomyces TaxID=2593676 RepID=UPI0035DDB759
MKVAEPSHADCAAQVRGIQAFHMDSNGWSDIAYSHLACVHGYLFQGRGENVRAPGQSVEWWSRWPAMAAAAPPDTRRRLIPYRTASTSPAVITS